MNIEDVHAFITKNINYTRDLRYDRQVDNDAELIKILFAKEVAYQEIIDFIENASKSEKAKFN